MILGLRERILDVDETVAIDNTGLTGEGLRAAVAEDHAQGLHPFVLSESNSVCLVQNLNKRFQLLQSERHHLAPSIGWRI
jgi:hypothetical protein